MADSPRGKPHPKNDLNDLWSKEWIKETKSWFVQDGTEKEWPTKKEHPATYPAAVAEKFVRMFTKEGMTVLDPMAGSGSTLIGAARLGRYGIGIDLYDLNTELFRTIIEGSYPSLEPKVLYYTGDAVDVMETTKMEPDFVMFSPPYYDTLHMSSGGADTRHKQRAREGLATAYGEDDRDLGNMDETEWMSMMVNICRRTFDVARDRAYQVIVIQNDAKYANPIAWKLQWHIANMTMWSYQGEYIWCQDNKALKIHGWPRRFSIANHHHYCLVWKKEEPVVL
jgi:DNA modification methylase